ncbi:portal protein [Ferrovibrio sp.]|uniref:portal protein n=1 Tax=Ferrovibrio sp. TaxID=1917215 RepID=UPI0035113120
MTRPSGTTPSGMMTPSDMMSTASARAAPVDAAALRRRHARAQARQQAWAGLWQDCYDYALPLRRPRDAMPAGSMAPPQRGGEKLFDATAADAADQLAASLLAQLAPPWSRWFAFQPGRDIPPERQGAAAALLDEAAQLLQAQFDRSNLAVVLNQVEAGHRSVFVAGWRPAVGWLCAAGIGWAWIGHPLFLWAAALWFPGAAPPAIETDGLLELVLALLGMAGLRSFEKVTGRAK